jgi:glucosamine-phosphate N-acetyltransferase
MCISSGLLQTIEYKEMPITIERVQRKHMEVVIDMLHRNMSQFRPPRDKLDEIWSSFELQNNVHSFVALLDDVVVGYGSVVIEMKIRGGHMGHIEDIVSHEDFRRKGIGKAIVSSLSDFAKEEGCYKLALGCAEHNVEFYRKCGYEIDYVGMIQF